LDNKQLTHEVLLSTFFSHQPPPPTTSFWALDRRYFWIDQDFDDAKRYYIEFSLKIRVFGREMDAAAGLALSSKMSQKVGCVVVQKGKIIAQAANQTVGTKPCGSLFNSVSRHAEQGAIEALLRRLRLLGQARLLLCQKECPQRAPSLQAAQDWRPTKEEDGKCFKREQGRGRRLLHDVCRPHPRIAWQPFWERKAVFGMRQVAEGVRHIGGEDRSILLYKRGMCGTVRWLSEHVQAEELSLVNKRSRIQNTTILFKNFYQRNVHSAFHGGR